MSDMVKSPDHYTRGGIECKDAIAAALTPEEFRGWCKGNAIKYVWREQFKNGDEDLSKADQFISFALEADEKPDEKPDEKQEDAESIEDIRKAILNSYIDAEFATERVLKDTSGRYPNFKGEAQQCAIDSHCCGKFIRLGTAITLNHRASQITGRLYREDFASILARMCGLISMKDCDECCPICRALEITEEECGGERVDDWARILQRRD